MDSGNLTSLDLNTMLLGMQAKCAVPFLAAVSHPLSSHGTPGQVSNFKSSCKGWPSLPLHPSCATETVWCHVQGPQELWSFMSQCRKNSARGKVIDNKWFIRIGSLWGLQEGWWEMSCPKNLPSYSFIIRGKVGRGKRTSLSFLSRCHASIISSSSRLGRVFLSLRGQARSTNYCFCVCREHGLGIIN